MLRKSIQERFWSKVDIKGKDECWEWKAGLTRYGYGYFWVNGKMVNAHRRWIMPLKKMLTLDALKKVVSKKNHNCLWCRKTIQLGEEHYYRKGRTSYYRYHISCVDNMVKDGRFDGLMAKDI